MKPYRAAVIGLGNIGLLYDLEPQRPHPSTHVLAYEENPSFQMVCGIDENTLRKDMLKRMSQTALFFEHLAEAYENRGLDNIDVVSICTPPYTHLAVLDDLLKKNIGRILFCEKPLVRNLEEVNELRRLIKKNPTKIIVPNISRRWNCGIRKVKEILQGEEYGKLQKINIRYTRGIFNTGSHLFDLLKMWTGVSINCVLTLSNTPTSAEPEKTYSFYFEQEDGVRGYAEAVDDREYYLFEIDLYLSKGKIEMRNSGDDMLYYYIGKHHLFEGFHELCFLKQETALLDDPCLRGAVKNIEGYLEGKEDMYCTIEDAFYPLYVAEALERSYHTKKVEDVCYG